MDDQLIEDEHLPLARKSVLPGTGFFVPDSLSGTRIEEETPGTLAGAEVVVIADPDADGLACAALVRRALGAGALVPAGPHELTDALAAVAEHAEPGVDVLVCDLAPDSYEEIAEPLDTLLVRAAQVRWFDHHQWDDDAASGVREAGVDLVIGDSDAECSADVTLRALDHDFDPRYGDLAAATRDHDLWIRADPRSDDLADYAYWTDPEEYVATVLDGGADLPAEAEAYLEERRVEKRALIERAIERAELREVGPWTVGVTYGRCSQNEVGEALRERGADAAVIVKPSGGVSIRGTETFERCHEVARQAGGGGHPKAAGCKPDVYNDMLDYAHHWTTRGATVKQVVLDAFRRLDAEGVE
jgi:oligoribonuclease NrnB/cAMP/cGMP phosphodiesterase (DHH superfamily)